MPRCRRACARRCDSAQLLGALREFYARCAVRARAASSAPRLKEVAAQQLRAALGASATAARVAVLCVLDNLNKGAAGGAVQWMNRLYGLPETAGLTAPAPGWT